MLTKTSVAAIRLLMHVARSADGVPASVRVAAGQLKESPTYLAKVGGLLAKAGLLRAQRGVTGGVLLARKPAEISMLAIVEACQGTILGDFCSDETDLRQACGFHRASAELYEATLAILSRWTLADLLRKPGPSCGFGRSHACWVQIGDPAPAKMRCK